MTPIAQRQSHLSLHSTILLTGATGFLGTQIARQILLNENATIIALVRANNSDAAEQRLQREWWDWPELRAAGKARVRVLPGDVTMSHLGLNLADFHEVTQQVTHIIHSAADVRLFEPIEALRRINVEGTRHVLEVAYAIHSDHGLARFAHVSTAYVSGERCGDIPEGDLSDNFGFSTPYEQSKYEAEMLVRQAAGELPISIFRPGMIVGDSQTGYSKTFNTLYYPLRLYMTGRAHILPAKPTLHVNLVPVNYVASAITRLTFDPRAAGLTFHLTPPISDQPDLAEITTFVRQWAAQNMNLTLPRVRFLPIWGLKQLARWLAKGLDRDLGNLVRLLPYFQKQPNFLRANTERLLGDYPHRWQQIMDPILAYAVHHSFWHRTTRTVHEQILYRLKSRRNPVTYHDLSGGEEHVRPAKEIHDEILAVCAAMRALGIVPGDRVAIAGHNSSRYFSALVACGLYGAISVPLYASSPPGEIQRLLADCQARLFLVGAPEIAVRLNEIHFDGPVVSFCQAEKPVIGSPEVIPWQEFLTLGQGQKATFSPPDLDAPTVLYYTSGTTDQPKGALFQHTQLRWLAETLAAMFPWRERNRWGSYLSYLPMNHVVEGVLASFSPYYVPAALDIYFLEEFDRLPQALKRVRPTIFFSVPRFFEKVREIALENRLIRVSQSLPLHDWRRSLLRPVLRRGLLQKAGLDKARMMIVGSAYSDPEMLNFFQAFGIPVHNAYGLTEAPLISLNRLGHNGTDTLGKPLPETQIMIEPDGEITVRGPQVAAGYVDGGDIHKLTQFPNGILKTGDLGCVNEDGHLFILGRKKDLIITSYGKKIHPAPIESSLRAIPGVSEAMLVGDKRPYCVALIWLEEDNAATAGKDCIEQWIIALNARLSHPEQIKRWTALTGKPTMINGDLTGSRKLKRWLVAERQAEIIDALYRGEAPPGTLFSGHLPIGA